MVFIKKLTSCRREYVGWYGHHGNYKDTLVTMDIPTLIFLAIMGIRRHGYLGDHESTVSLATKGILWYHVYHGNHKGGGVGVEEKELSTIIWELDI